MFFVQISRIHKCQITSYMVNKKECVKTPGAESRQDQEEGGELDFQEEASPEEIKSREVVLG